MIYTGGNSIVGAYTNGVSVKEIYTNGVKVWPSETPPVLQNKIYYTSWDGNIVTPYKTSVSDWGVNIVSNTYSDGQGVIEFDGPILSICSYAFEGCTKLSSVVIPESVTSIGDCAFELSGVSSVEIQGQLLSIGDCAFRYCSRLRNFVIPASVTTIGNDAFGHSVLRSINIPASVTSIGNGICNTCLSLTSITVDINNVYYDSRDNCNAIIEKLGSKLVQGCINTVIPNDIVVIGKNSFKGIKITSITIPSTVTTIENGAFHLSSTLSSGLTSVTIPSSVTSIGGYAFNFQQYLSEVIVNALVPPSLGDLVFDNEASGRLIKVPSDLVQTYQTASGWSRYASSIVSQ